MIKLKRLVHSDGTKKFKKVATDGTKKVPNGLL